MEQIGHYKIEQLIGEGGMARVYRAQDTRLRRPVALKVIREELAQDPKAVQRFFREARLAAALRHPNLVTLYDCSPPEVHPPYLVTELLEGGTLREQLEAHGPMMPHEAALIVAPVARALGAAHQAGIVHRDVKPDNILIDRDGDRTSIKLADFGVAFLAREARITTAGGISGSVAYMAPEQLRDGDATPASDIWSLGVTFCELLTAQPPGAGLPLGQFIVQLLQQNPDHDPLAQLAGLPPLPQALAEVLRGCLIAAPQQRIADGAQLSASLIAALSQDGLTQLEEELSQWGAGAASYRAGLQQRLVKVLLARAQREPRIEQRAEALEQVLQLAPDHPEALAQLEGLGVADGALSPPGERRGAGRAWLWGALGVVVIIAGGLAAWRFWERPAAPTPDAASVMIAARVDARAAAAARPSDAAPAAMKVDAPAAPRPPRSQPRHLRPRRRSKQPGRVRELATLQLTTEPWARVLVDGQERGITPKLKQLQLPVGRHQIVLQNPACHVRQLAIDLQADQTLVRHIKLKPLPARLSLRSPPGWRVEVDGKKWGRTPLPLLSLEHGVHQLRLITPEGKQLQRSVTLSAGKLTTLDLME